MGLATRYEQNLVNLINSLRNYYENRYPGKVAEQRALRPRHARSDAAGQHECG